MTVFEGLLPELTKGSVSLLVSRRDEMIRGLG